MTNDLNNIRPNLREIYNEMRKLKVDCNEEMQPTVKMPSTLFFTLVGLLQWMLNSPTTGK